MHKLVNKNRFGFFELADKPTPDRLSKYYAEKYYQNAVGSYEKKYTAEEHAYLNNKIEQRYTIIVDLLAQTDHKGRTFLDVGCGEGWALKFFKDRAWDVWGLDYSKYGCETQNPAYLDNLYVGDIYTNIKSFIRAGCTFDCIWLDNVLEHVLDPLSLVTDCHSLIKGNGVLVIEVPNDFSAIQQHLLENGMISKEFWVVNPDHISYFNKEGLSALCDEAGWATKYVMGDYPIDFNLFNPHTNYIENSAVGKSCHQSRVVIENLLHAISVEKVNELYKAFAGLGLGRQIIAFFQKKEEIWSR